MAPHSSTLAWKIPWTGELVGWSLETDDGEQVGMDVCTWEGMLVMGGCHLNIQAQGEGLC